MDEKLRTCHQAGCDTDAFYRYTWPGRDEAGICVIHAIKAQGVAAAMGLPLQMIPLYGRDVDNG